VALITVQAGVAADALGRRPEEARAALGTLRSAGRDAMAEVAAMVAVLRQGGDGGPAATDPAPGLDRVGDLVHAARTAGVDVDLHTDLGGGPVPGMVGLTAYRVVQEGLTNVVRHAGARRVRVRLERGPERLVVEVRDDGRGGVTPATPGAGLTGMRERVESLGGTRATARSRAAAGRWWPPPGRWRWPRRPACSW
jgi:signal transduction histidine kinase